MQVVDLVGQVLESGKVTIFTKHKDMEVSIANRKIDINTTNKEFLKSIISVLRERDKKENLSENIKQSINEIKLALSVFKDVAEEFNDKGITVTISYKGDKVITMGADADAKFSRIATRTKAIEINSLTKLIELGI